MFEGRNVEPTGAEYVSHFNAFASGSPNAAVYAVTNASPLFCAVSELNSGQQTPSEAPLRMVEGNTQLGEGMTTELRRRGGRTIMLLPPTGPALAAGISFNFVMLVKP